MSGGRLVRWTSKSVVAVTMRSWFLSELRDWICARLRASITLQRTGSER